MSDMCVSNNFGLETFHHYIRFTKSGDPVLSFMVALPNWYDEDRIGKSIRYVDGVIDLMSHMPLVLVTMPHATGKKIIRLLDAISKHLEKEKIRHNKWVKKHYGEEIDTVYWKNV